MSPERKIEAHLVKLARKHGWFCRKVRWIGRNGCPDRYLIPPGGFPRWVELKAPGKKPTKAQAAEHARMRAAGEFVVVVDSIAKVEGMFFGSNS